MTYTKTQQAYNQYYFSIKVAAKHTYYTLFTNEKRI